MTENTVKGSREKQAPWTFLLDFAQGSTFIESMSSFIYRELYNVKYSLQP